MLKRDQFFLLAMILMLGLIFASVWIGITLLDPDTLSNPSDQALLTNRAIAMVASAAVFAIILIALTAVVMLFYYMKHFARQAETRQRIAVYEQLNNELWYAEQRLRHNAASWLPASSTPGAHLKDNRSKIVSVDFSTSLYKRQ